MPTTVKVGLSATKNLGNFENLKIEVSVETETRPEETASAAIDRVYALVEKKLDEKLQEATGE